MSITTFLAGIGNFLQSVVNFFFSSKWTIPIIIFIIILYFLWKGMEAKEKEEDVRKNNP